MSNDIVKTLSALVGNGGAFSIDDKRAAEHRRRYASIAAELNRKLLAVVLPDNIETLQKTVQLATAQNLSIWHQPNGAGNGVALSDDNGPVLVVDTRRLDRILEVNPDSAYALLEPGVSYRQLYDYLKKEKIPLWIDADRNPDHSVAGSILGRHIGYTPYGEHFLMQCGMEVVLKDGGLLRTGMGALPGNNTWQLFKYNFGPYIDGLFSQSDLGLPGKIGLWLMPAPPEYFPFMVTLSRLEDLQDVVEILRPLKIGSVIPNTVAVSHGAFDAAVSGGRRGEWIQQGELNTAKLAEQGLGIWNVYAALYGSRDNIDLIWQAVKPALQAIDGARVFKGEERNDDPVWRSRRTLMGGGLLPSAVDFSGWGGANYLRLTAAAPMEGEYAMQMYRLVTETLAGIQADYLCEYALTGRTMFKQIYLPYDDGNQELKNKIKAAAVAVAARMVASGFSIVDESPELRPGIDRVYGENGFTDLVGRLRSTMKQQGA